MSANVLRAMFSEKIKECAKVRIEKKDNANPALVKVNSVIAMPWLFFYTPSIEVDELYCTVVHETVLFLS